MIGLTIEFSVGSFQPLSLWLCLYLLWVFLGVPSRADTARSGLAPNLSGSSPWHTFLVVSIIAWPTRINGVTTLTSPQGQRTPSNPTIRLAPTNQWRVFELGERKQEGLVRMGTSTTSTWAGWLRRTCSWIRERRNSRVSYATTAGKHD